MAHVREVVRLGRNLRKKEGHRVRQPLSRLTVLTRDSTVAGAVEAHVSVIADELNVKQVTVSADEAAFVHLSAKANYRKLGPVLGSGMTDAATAIAELSGDQIEDLLKGGSTELAGLEITLDDILIERTPVPGTIVESGPEFACALDTTITRDLKLEGLAREIVSKVQNMRREAGLQVTDRIHLTWQTTDNDVVVALDQYGDHITSEVLATELAKSSDLEAPDVEIDGYTIRLEIVTI
jgi:isoleucyl-tRNA synthetase